MSTTAEHARATEVALRYMRSGDVRLIACENVGPGQFHALVAGPDPATPHTEVMRAATGFGRDAAVELARKELYSVAYRHALEHPSGRFARRAPAAAAESDQLQLT